MCGAHAYHIRVRKVHVLRILVLTLIALVVMSIEWVVNILWYRFNKNIVHFTLPFLECAYISFPSYLQKGENVVGKISYT
jgi:hypothetical protein